MKLYIGRRNFGRAVVEVMEGAKYRPLHHIIRHSPTGMEWGYGGSGPGDLALSILTDLLGAEEANRHYMAFKWAFVCNLAHDEWALDERVIREWLAGHLQKARP